MGTFPAKGTVPYSCRKYVQSLRIERIGLYLLSTSAEILREHQDSLTIPNCLDQPVSVEMFDTNEGAKRNGMRDLSTFFLE